MAKYVAEWYNSIGFFKKQTYILLVNQLVNSGDQSVHVLHVM